MRKIIIVSLMVFATIVAKAQQDSCYIYTQLHWVPTAMKYVAKIQLSEEFKDMDIVDENGSKLSFYNIFHALNYLSTKGWELVQMSPNNPDGNTNKLEQYAVIRKKMPIEEAKKYSTPKEK